MSRTRTPLRAEPLEDRTTPTPFGPTQAYTDLAPPVSSLAETTDVATADFNRDDFPDLATVRSSGEVTVYLNNGSGRFTPTKLLTAGQGAQGLTLIQLGDFNGDGNPDIVAPGGTSITNPVLLLFLGDGRGGFGDGVPVPTPLPFDKPVAVADFNGDGLADLVLLDANFFSVLLGHRDGTLGPGSESPTLPSSSTLGLATGDFTGDGRPDVVIVRTTGEAVVFPGNGDGTFGTPVSSPALTAEQADARRDFSSNAAIGTVAAGDFDKDGKPDLVVLARVDDSRQAVFLHGNGDGTFAAPVTGSSVFAAYSAPVVGDFNGDGSLDAAVGNIAALGPGDNPMAAGPTTPTQGAVVLFGNGRGAFTAVGVNLRNENGGPVPVAAADFNGDGRSDLAGGRFFAQGGVMVALAEPPSNTPPTGPVFLAGSGSGGGAVFQIDAATGQPRRLLTDPPLASTGSARVASADVTGDGVPDLVVGAGPGGPPVVQEFDGVSGRELVRGFAFEPTFTGGVFVAAGDLDGDGRAEIIATPDQGGGPNVVIFSPDTTATTVGTLGTPKAFFALGNPAFRGGARPAVGDVNGDGTPDLAVGAGFLGGPVVEIHDGKALAAGDFTTLIGGGFFAFDGPDAETLRNGVFVAVGDINGDGFGDLVAGGGPGGGPRVLVLDGKMLSAGNYAAAYANPVANFFFGNPADRGGVRVAVHDLDGDERADLIVGSGEGLPPAVRVYHGKDFVSTAEPSVFQDVEPFGVALSGGVFVG
jgi:hypothetical protein